MNTTMAADKADYLVRQDSPTDFTVTKWLGGERPVSEYAVFRSRDGHFTCTCPAGERDKPCKHAEIVREWIKAGSKIGKMIEAAYGYIWGE